MNVGSRWVWIAVVRMDATSAEELALCQEAGSRPQHKLIAAAHLLDTQWHSF
jgi:hypothetical protein